jgi:hypothetical protein
MQNNMSNMQNVINMNYIINLKTPFQYESPPVNMTDMLNMQKKMRWAGLRSNVAVDMFGRGAAVTIILFSSGNAQQAVPRNSLLRRCWSYANNVPNNFPQPSHSVSMARPSVFFPDLREICIAAAGPAAICTWALHEEICTWALQITESP